MWNWTKEQAGPIAAIATVLIVLTGLIQFGVINPMHQRFDAINQRFDAQDKHIEDLAKGVSDLRKLGERVSRNEGEIDVIRQQLQTADVPSP